MADRAAIGIDPCSVIRLGLGVAATAGWLSQTRFAAPECTEAREEYGSDSVSSRASRRHGKLQRAQMGNLSRAVADVAALHAHSVEQGKK
jgi:hypothetical protein